MYNWMISWNVKERDGVMVYGIECFKTKREALEYSKMMEGNVSEVLRINDFADLERTNRQKVEAYKDSLHEILPIQTH